MGADSPRKHRILDRAAVAFELAEVSADTAGTVAVPGIDPGEASADTLAGGTHGADIDPLEEVHLSGQVVDLRKGPETKLC